MNREDIYKSLLSRYCKQIVHMRQQYHITSSNLGIVLGAGASKDIGLPDWKELVKRIEQNESMKDLEVKIFEDGDPIANAQLLFQAYKSHMINNCDEIDKEYNRIDMKIRAQWQRIVHSSLYKNVEADVKKLVPEDHYLWSLVKIIKVV